MPKKKSRSKGYKSQGLHSTVSAWAKRASRKDKRTNPDLLAFLRRETHRSMVIAKPRNDKEKKLKDRYVKQNDTAQAASSIYNRYIVVGITWGRVVQAVITNQVESLEKKWSPIKEEFLAKNRGYGAMSYGLRS